MRDAAGTVSGTRWSVLLTIVLLPIMFVGMGAWEVCRGAATRAEYEQVAAAAETRVAEAQDAAEASVLVVRLREVAAWLALTAGLVTGAAGVAGLLLVSRSARRGARSRPELVDAFGRVSRTLPVLLGTQVVGTLLGLFGVVAFEAAGLWFLPDPDDRTGLLGILVVIGTGLALWGGLGTLRNLRRALRAFAPRPLAIAAIPIEEPRAPGLFACCAPSRVNAAPNRPRWWPRARRTASSSPHFRCCCMERRALTRFPRADARCTFHWP